MPTTAEAGLAGYAFGNWFGLVAPPGTPSALARRLAEVVNTLLRDPEVDGHLVE